MVPMFFRSPLVRVSTAAFLYVCTLNIFRVGKVRDYEDLREAQICNNIGVLRALKADTSKLEKELYELRKTKYSAP